MRLGRIASIVIISTGVAAPAPGPAVDAARALFDRGNASDALGDTHAAKADDAAAQKRDPSPAAPMAVPMRPTADAPVPPEQARQQPSSPDANLRRSVEDRSVERHSAEPKGAAAAKGTVQLGAFTSEAAARDAWAKISAASDGALGGLTPITVPVPAKAHLWRLRTTVSDQTAARKLCAALLLRKQVCVVAKD